MPITAKLRAGAARRMRGAVVDLWQEQEVRSNRERSTRSPIAVDLLAAAVLLTAIAVILLIRYYGLSRRAEWVVDLLDLGGLDDWSARLDVAWTTSEHAAFNRYVYWALFRIVAYIGPAVLVARFVLRRPLRDLGARIDTRWADIRPYLVLYALMVPLVVLASTSGEFRAQYPLYDPAPGADLWPRFVVWELLYLGQFLALEFFFRGFVLHALAPRLGAFAIPVMVVPYVAIHLTKPLPEAIGSIVAGTVLGFFALRTGSVWWGALLHFAVALTIDLLTV